jgi:hypothetical protein
MRKTFTCFVLLLAFSPAFSQKQISKEKRTGPPEIPGIQHKNIITEIVEYAGGQGTGIYVPPPKEFLQRRNQRTTANDLFNVTYNGFPDSVRQAFQFALDIWATLVTSEVPITVEANWVQMESSVLGSALPGTAYTNIFYSRKFDAWHPVSLAEKIIGENLNETDPDIIANFNNSVKWNTDTLGNPAPDEFDLVTVVLHEICHGMGFLDFTDVEAGFGFYNFQEKPWIYTTFLENTNGENIVNTYDNQTMALANQLQSDKLVFHEKISLAKYNNNLTKVPIYAPLTYEPGSSISHLDQDVPSVYGLMRPGISKGDAIHDPSIAVNMLEDMGWALTFINHDGTPNTEDVDNPKTVTANITSDTDVDSASFILVYSTEFENDPFTTPSLTDTVQFASVLQGNFEAMVPDFNGTPTLYSYYLVIKDEYGRVFTNPPEAPEFYYQFGASPDDFPPSLTHNPIFFVEQGTVTVPVSATVTDFIGVNSVSIEYQIDGAPQGSFDLILDPNSSSLYKGSFTLSASLPVSTVINYKITATDDAMAQNQSFFPETGFQSFTIIEPVAPVKVYTNNFNDTGAGDDFVGNLFSAQNVVGFSSPAFHSPHPYGTGPVNDAVEYITELKIPIILDNDSAFIQFDEVVLVEPGDPGSVFGNIRFWDYVIVEGSKDKGASWLPFGNGYDCRANSNWFDTYNSDFDPSTLNSGASGDSDLYADRKIDMLANGNFSADETVRIRFRLWSDELAVGWGWVIDNLRIQSLITGIDEVIDEESFVIYPNPSSGNFTLKAQLNEPISNSRIHVTNLLGKSIFLKQLDSKNTIVNEVIDLSNFPDGLYIITLETPKGRITRKVIKVY